VGRIKIKKSGKKAAARALALITALSVMLGGLFESPAELGSEAEASPAPAAICAVAGDDEELDSDSAQEPLPEKKRRGWRSSLKALVLRLPLFIRVTVLIPLWCLGYLIIAGVSALWGPVLSAPVTGILKALCTAGILSAAVLITVKTAFPEVPVKKVLGKKNVYFILIASAAFGAAGALLQIFCPQTENIRAFLESAALLLLLCLAAVPVLRRERKKRNERALCSGDIIT
jgi:hypothetical protein